MFIPSRLPILTLWTGSETTSCGGIFVVADEDETRYGFVLYGDEETANEAVKEGKLFPADSQDPLDFESKVPEVKIARLRDNFPLLQGWLKAAPPEEGDFGPDGPTGRGGGPPGMPPGAPPGMPPSPPPGASPHSDAGQQWSLRSLQRRRRAAASEGALLLRRGWPEGQAYVQAGCVGAGSTAYVQAGCVGAGSTALRHTYRPAAGAGSTAFAAYVQAGCVGAGSTASTAYVLGD